MKGKVQATDLHRIVYNTRQYAVKSGSVEGASLWIRGASSLRVVSSDDFIILVDKTEVDTHSNAQYWVVDRDTLEGVWKRVEKEPEGLFDLAEISTVDNHIWLETLDEADQVVHETDHFDTIPVTGFAVSPSRLTKLRLIKPGGYPIDIKAFRSPTGPTEEVIGFRIGPTVRGVIAPLNRETQELPEGSLW